MSTDALIIQVTDSMSTDALIQVTDSATIIRSTDTLVTAVGSSVAGPTGATGATGAAGSSGVVSVTAPITNSGTSSAAQIGVDQSALTITESQVTGLTTDLATKAPLASPALTGSPTAPTQTAGDNSTKIATTAYADLKLAKAGGTMTGPITGFQDKGGQVFNVKAYGATGDGTTDDTAAIVAATSAANGAGGGCVYFPQGTYAVKIQATTMRTNRYYAIPVYPNVRFAGASKTASIIKLVGLVTVVSTNPWSVFGYATTDSGGAELQDITIDMNSAAMGSPSVSANLPNLTMEIAGATTPIRIQNVWVKNVDSINTFYFITSNHCSIDQLTISCVAASGDTYHDYSAIYWTAKNTTTSSLRITNTVCQAASIPVAGATTFIEVHGPNVVIANNTSQNMQTFANLTGITGTSNASQSRNISVVGNVAKGAQYGCIVWSESGSAGYVTTPLANVEIVGNTFDLDPLAWSTSASAAPVGCATGVLMDTGSTQNGVQNLTINSNIINYASSYDATDTSGLGSAIKLSQGTVSPNNPNFNWTIQNNTINSPQAVGINTGNTFVTGLTITGNTIRNCGQNTTISATSPYRSGILVSSDGVNFVVSNNNIYDDQASPTMAFGVAYSPQTNSGHNISNSTCINNNISTASYSQSFVPIYCDTSSGNLRYPLIQHNSKYGWLPTGPAQVNSTITDSVLGLTSRQTAQPSGATWQADALPLSATSPNLAAVADALPNSITSWVTSANTTNVLDTTVAPLVSGSTWVKTSGTGVASGLGPTVTAFINVTAGQTYSASAWGLLPTDNIFTGTASATSSTTLTVSTPTFTAGSLVGSTVTATSGGTTTTGVVTSNTTTTLTVSAGWSNGTPDVTSSFSFTFGSQVYFYVAVTWYNGSTQISAISAHSAQYLKLGVPANSISVSGVAPDTATRARVSVHLGGPGLAANGGYFWTSAIAFCNGDTANFTVPGTPTLSNSTTLPAQLTGATLTSPNLVLSPTAPTQTAGDNSTKIATTAFVTGAVTSEATARDTAITNAKGLPIGLTGATSATRFVGGTTSGAPTSGTFAVGDFVIDRTAAIWICTVAGTPGTWSAIGGSGGGTTAIANGGTGATTAATALSNLGAQPGTSQRSVYTTAGSFSGVSAPSWANSAIVYLVGGGGGGGGGTVSATTFGAAGGGAAGTVIARTIPVTGGASYSGVVGAGGTGGAAGVNPASGTNGTSGTSTSLTIGSLTLTAPGGRYGTAGNLGSNGLGGSYGIASNSGSVSSFGAGGTGSATLSLNNAQGPVPFGAGGGSGGFQSTGASSLGGKGGIGGTTTSGQIGGTVSSTSSGTDGTAGESSSSTSPGGGGGGGGGAAFTGGTAGAGGAGGTGSVVIVWQAS